MIFKFKSSKVSKVFPKQFCESILDYECFVWILQDKIRVIDTVSARETCSREEFDTISCNL